MSVRVRYAPSPTGLQHIGGIRTALFNFLFARVNGGQFIIRVEDTDRERSNPEAWDDLYSSLEWLGIEADEDPLKGGPSGPYVQSERADLYREYAEQLLEKGYAYRCFCSPERLEQLRKEQSLDPKGPQGYDRLCRNLDAKESEARASAGEPHVLRFAIPLEGKTSFEDLILGTTGRKNRDINPDPVILKTDGFPTYHLANVIDDHTMGITHIMRAQEWVPSGPLHVLLYNALGWEAPVFCHLPMVMGTDGSKLSKRHGATALREFRHSGYLPEALINFLALLGWAYDDSREFFTLDELCQLFTLEKINKAPAVFDYRKLEWFNSHYIRSKKADELLPLLVKQLQKDRIISEPPTQQESAILQGAFPIIHERMKVIGNVTPLLRFLFADPGTGNVEDAIPKKQSAEQTVIALQLGLELLEQVADPPDVEDQEACTAWDEEQESRFRTRAEEREIKIGVLLQPLRVGVTGSKISPPLFPSIRLLGMEESLRRTRRLLNILGRG